MQRFETLLSKMREWGGSRKIQTFLKNRCLRLMQEQPYLFYVLKHLNLELVKSGQEPQDNQDYQSQDSSG